MPRQKSGKFDQLQYIADYNKEFVKYRKLSLNISKAEDVAILQWVDAQPEGASSYLKRLIRQDMIAMGATPQK